MTVTPSPPSCDSAGRARATYGLRARCSRTAALSAPLPWPCRTCTASSLARRCRSSSSSSLRSASSTRIPRTSTKGTRNSTGAARARWARSIRSSFVLRNPLCATRRAMGTSSSIATLVLSAPICTVAWPSSSSSTTPSVPRPTCFTPAVRAALLALLDGRREGRGAAPEALLRPRADVGGNADAPRDLDGRRRAHFAHAQRGGGRELLDVEADARRGEARVRQSERFQFLEVRGDQDLRARRHQLLQRGDGDGRAFARVGVRGDLVDQHEPARPRR